MIERFILAVLIFLGNASAVIGATTSYYVDPDWAGTQSGTTAQPWASLDSTKWVTINTALSNGPVNLYLSALKANGTTNQSKAWFLEIRRYDPSANRLTVDGYSFYNTNTTTPSWISNPNTNIATAYTNFQLFKLTGSGSEAIGWSRDAGNDFVLNGGLAYCCIKSHLASSDNQPGVGASWTNFWDQHGSASTPWASGATYKCYPKQDNVTLRGFEITDRVGIAGDNLIYEYINSHNVSGGSPAIGVLYTTYPDGPGLAINSRWSTNMTLRNFQIYRCKGEGLYIGSINPDATEAFQVAHGNQHRQILVTNAWIFHPGYYGDQGDAIDCKHGVVDLRIVDCNLEGFDANGINMPHTATSATPQNNIVERCYIHDSVNVVDGVQNSIVFQTGGETSTGMYGYLGATVRNCVFSRNKNGIFIAGSAGKVFDGINLYNNTVYAIANSGIVISGSGGLITNCLVTNNFVFLTGNPRGDISSTGVKSDYNAHDGTWTSAAEGAHTLTLSTANALLSVVNTNTPDLHLSGTPATLVDAGATIASFSDDKDQLARGAAWDIGAYELNASPPLPVTNATLIVMSSNPISGVAITASPNDRNGNGNGTTSFTRIYSTETNTVVSLVAPSTVITGGVTNNFSAWQLDGDFYSMNIDTTISMLTDHIATALYITPLPPPPPSGQTRARRNPFILIRR